jgi:trehalose 6-phosphate synthase
MRSLFAYDLVGFQSEADVNHFARYVGTETPADILGEHEFRAFGKTLQVQAFPIGTDVDEFIELGKGREAMEMFEQMRSEYSRRRLLLGVERMDYSKGLPQRMEAFGRMLDEHEELHGKVSFLQIAPPSREAVDAYQVLREELDRLSGRINGDYADLDWMPIRYLARSYSRGSLCGLFRLARVGLVTPLYDGMNLVAKEYVAAQDPEDPGALVLSEFAGAAEQLQSAILVNPHDIGASAEAIFRALSMPVEERRERWQDLIRAVREQDIAWWRRRFLEVLDATRGAA